MTQDGESVGNRAIAAGSAGADFALSRQLPVGADPDAVRDWFELKTIVDLPAPALSFAEAEAEAEAAAADYRRAAHAENTRRAYRAGLAASTEWCAVHRHTAQPAAPETIAAFLAAEAGRGLAVNTLRLRHAALRYLHLLAGYPPPTASPIVSATFAGIHRAHRRPLHKKTALVLDPLRAAVRAIPDTYLAGIARPRLAARRLCRGAQAERTRGPDDRAAEPARRRHRPVAAVAQERPGGPWHDCLAASRQDRSVPRSEPSKPGSLPPASAPGRCFAGCGVCRRRASTGVPNGNR
jgi:hypothetical protein